MLTFLTFAPPYNILTVIKETNFQRVKFYSHSNNILITAGCTRQTKAGHLGA